MRSRNLAIIDTKFLAELSGAESSVVDVYMESNTLPLNVILEGNTYISPGLLPISGTCKSTFLCVFFPNETANALPPRLTVRSDIPLDVYRNTTSVDSLAEATPMKPTWKNESVFLAYLEEQLSHHVRLHIPVCFTDSLLVWPFLLCFRKRSVFLKALQTLLLSLSGLIRWNSAIRNAVYTIHCEQ